MVASPVHQGHAGPFSLLVNGEAGDYVEALEQIVGQPWLRTYRVGSDNEMLQLVREGVGDAVVLDEAATELDPLRMLRMIHRLNEALLVVLLTRRSDRRWMEQALRLTAFSVVIKPLRLEELLGQIHRMMVRLDAAIRKGTL